MGNAAALALGSYDVSKDVLHQETIRLAAITMRVGRRLKNYIGKLGDHATPDEDTRETMRWYKDTVLGLLKEQRERARLAAAAGVPELSEPEYDKAIAALKREALLEMSDEEMAKLMAERAQLSTARSS